MHRQLRGHTSRNLCNDGASHNDSDAERPAIQSDDDEELPKKESEAAPRFGLACKSLGELR